MALIGIEGEVTIGVTHFRCIPLTPGQVGVVKFIYLGYADIYVTTPGTINIPWLFVSCPERSGRKVEDTFNLYRVCRCWSPVDEFFLKIYL